MKIRRRKTWLVSTFGLCATFMTLTLGLSLSAMSQNQSFVTIIPASFEGNSYSTIPFTGSSDSVRYQQVYDAAGFTDRGYTGPFLIQHLEFRLDTEVGLSTGGFTTDFPAFQLDLSTTTRAVDGLSANFSENVGADDKTVIASGPIRLGASGVRGEEPQQFTMFINFPTPFYYDPSRGNLLMDIRNYGGGRTSIGDPPFFGLAYVDAENMTGDAISSVYANSVDATSGTVDSLGFVTGFYMTPVPEPSSLALLAVGLVTIVLGWKRMKKGRNVAA